MNIGLWIVQVMLALAFGMAGATKLFTPMPELMEMMPWVAQVPAFMPRLAGASEILAMLGLILPSVTRIKPWLTPLAAWGLVAVMVLGSGLHASLGEFQALPVNFVLASLAGFVAWGRSKRLAIEPREPADSLPVLG